MKRVPFGWLFSGIVGVCTFAAMAETGRVFVVPSTTKMIRDQEPPPEATAFADIHAGRGGWASFQVFVRAGTTRIADVTAKVSELKNENGAIPASAVDVRNVAYVPVAQATPYEALAWPEMFNQFPIRNGLLHGRDPKDIQDEPSRMKSRSPWKAGQIGDVLPPMTPQTVGPFYNGGSWVRVQVPADQPPGIYLGEVTLTGKDFKAAVPVRLQVWSFTIPYASHLPWHIGTVVSANLFDREGQRGEFLRSGMTLKSLDANNPGEGAKDRELYFKMLDWFLEYRITPSLYGYPRPKPGLRMDLLDPEILKRVKDGRCAFIDLMSFDTALSDKELEMLAELRRLGLHRKVFIRINEESARTEVTAKVGAAIREKFPEAILGGTIPGTISKNKSLFGVINYWCVEWGWFDPEETLERQKAGDIVTWYTCCGPRYPYPNMFLDEPSLDQRIYGWMASKYDIQGVLYYGAGYWQSDATNKGADPTVEVCSDWARWGTLNQNGSGNHTIGPHNHCGVLVYPGDKYGLDHPVASVRLENLRSGIEDFETLWLLEQRINELKAELDPQGKVLGDWDGKARRKEILANAVETISVFVRDPIGFQHVQRELCKELDTLTSGPKVLFKVQSEGRGEINVTGVAAQGVEVLLDGKKLTGAFTRKLKTGRASPTVFVVQVTQEGRTARISRRLAPPSALQ